MPEKDTFQITKPQYDGLSGRISSLEQHQHTGIDSFQVDQKNLLNAQYYALFTKITINSTQILALHATPQQLVPAAGTNTVIVVDSIVAKIAFNTIAYTGANNLEFRYTNGSGTKVTTDMGSAFLDSSSTAYDIAPHVATELTPTSNAAIVVVVPTANPAAGNSVITFITKYRVLTF